MQKEIDYLRGSLIGACGRRETYADITGAVTAYGCTAWAHSASKKDGASSPADHQSS